MRLSVFSAAMIIGLSIAAGAAADPAASGAAPAQVRPGQMVRSADGAAIGRIDYVERGKDGKLRSVGVIYDMRIVHIPTDSLTAAETGYVTSLTKAQVRELN